jgi:hypothetical protein
MSKQTILMIFQVIIFAAQVIFHKDLSNVLSDDMANSLLVLVSAGMGIYSAFKHKQLEQKQATEEKQNVDTVVQPEEANQPENTQN